MENKPKYLIQTCWKCGEIAWKNLPIRPNRASCSTCGRHGKITIAGHIPLLDKKGFPVAYIPDTVAR